MHTGTLQPHPALSATICVCRSVEDGEDGTILDQEVLQGLPGMAGSPLTMAERAAPLMVWSTVWF